MGAYIGGSSEDWAIDVAVDDIGNAYVTGWTYSSDFPTTPGAYDVRGNVSSDSDDVFLAKFDPTGHLLFSTYLGGRSEDYGSAVALDPDGNIYVTGGTSSSDFPATKRANDRQLDGTWDAFVAKFDSVGGLLYSTFLGGPLDDEGDSIDVDGQGSAYITGYTDHPGTLVGADNKDAFLAELGRDGTSLKYFVIAGGSGFDEGQAIAVDPSGNAYVAGLTESSDFPVTSDAFDGQIAGGDAFVLKANAAGDIVYATFLGGGSCEGGYGIALDSEGDVHVGGVTCSADFPTTPGAFDRSLDGPFDAFATQFNATGKLISSTFVGGERKDIGYNIFVDEADRVYLVGWTNSEFFPTSLGAFDATWNDQKDAFVVRLAPEATSLEYGSYLGGALDALDNCCGDIADSVVLDATGNVTVVGVTVSTDFPTTQNATDTSYNGDIDAFIARIELVPDPNRVPVAAFQLFPSESISMRILADATRSADAEDRDSLLEVRWDWEGDGLWDTEWSTAKQAEHDYRTAGTYTLWLEVRDMAGLTGSAEEILVVSAPSFGPAPLEAYISADLTQAVPGFSASASGGNPPYAFHWDFGDGTTSDRAEPQHAYLGQGSYNVTLTVTDARGRSVTRSIQVVVPPPGSLALPLSVVLLLGLSAVAGGSLLAYSWFRSRGHRRHRKED